MNKNSKRHKFRIVLLMCFIVSFSMNIQTLHATSDKTSISKKNVIAYTNMSTLIKINNPSAKVKWTTSNKKIASLLGTRGENNSIVTIKTGKNTGTCMIKATMGNEVYSCKITVKKDTKIFRATLVKVTQKKKEINVRLKIKNNTSKTQTFGESFWVEKFIDGKWVKMKMKRDMVVHTVARLVPSKDSVKKSYNISAYYKSSDFTKGVYRIHIDSRYKDKYNYVIFNIR